LKTYISANLLEQDCWAFAKKLYAEGHDFDLFVGVTRGGAQISIYMQEVFSLLTGTDKPYTTVQARSYTGVFEAGEVDVDGLSTVVTMAKQTPKILVIDDIFDRGKTLLAIKTKLQAALKAEGLSPQLQFAALYYKPENVMVDMVPDFHYKTFASAEWIVLPHELSGLTKAELAQKGFEL
jgi:hypoxanthine phosphoribosyltransferase